MRKKIYTADEEFGSVYLFLCREGSLTWFANIMTNIPAAGASAVSIIS